ncbi:MAG: alpha-ketoacid dehydrogenase subunit beta [Acidimicrobiales bacterium]|nr:alpha-ketoacid dehydrogenase subunit beta [Acidimicrobiales bacterium]
MTAVDPGAAEAAPTLPFALAVNQALDVALGLDDSVFLLGEDIAEPSGGVYKVTNGLSEKYGTHRVRKTPISEQAIVGAATGAAIAGMRPVAEIMIMDFLAVCLDQLANHAAKIRYMSGGQTTVPLVIRTSAGAGMQFGAQHSELLEAWLVHTPGMKVVVPSTPADAKGLLLSAIFDDDPVLFVEQMLLYYAVTGPVPPGDHRVPLGVAAVRREGDDVTLVSYGRQVADCLAVADRLAGEGVSCEVVDLRSLVPLDEATMLGSVAKTTRAVVVHEAVTRAGFGAELSSRIHEELFADLAAPVQRVGGMNTPVPYARQLEQAFLPTQDRIAAAVLRAVG